MKYENDGKRKEKKKKIINNQNRLNKQGLLSMKEKYTLSFISIRENQAEAQYA